MATDPTARLASQLLLIARDPRSGRLRYPGSLNIGLRAALLGELVLDGRVTQRNRAPFALNVGETDDRILDAVARTVEDRPGVAWWRWFRHTHVDQVALSDDLVGFGRWTPRGGGLRSAFDDAAQDATLQLAFEASEVAEGRAAAKDARQAMLAVLSVMCGATTTRPRPRALKRELKPIVGSIERMGEPGADLLPAVLHGAAVFARKPLRR